MYNLNEIEIDDSDDDGVGIKVPVVWTGAMNGILSGSDASLQGRITTQMNQIFEQSPYLAK